MPETAGLFYSPQKTGTVTLMGKTSMQIIINGSTETIPDGLTIAGFLTEWNLDPDAVVVELNAAIIDKLQYAEIGLKENDRMEVLRFVGGG